MKGKLVDNENKKILINTKLIYKYNDNKYTTETDSQGEVVLSFIQNNDSENITGNHFSIAVDNYKSVIQDYITSDSDNPIDLLVVPKD